MKRIGRLIFLVTFALLQCVSPLAHAHLGGDAAGGRFHVFHFHDGQQEDVHDHGSRVSSASHGFATSDHPAVKVPDGKRRHYAGTVAFSPAVAQRGMPLHAPVMMVNSGCCDYTPVIPPSPFFKRHSQAPPRCA